MNEVKVDGFISYIQQSPHFSQWFLFVCFRNHILFCFSAFLIARDRGIDPKPTKPILLTSLKLTMEEFQPTEKQWKPLSTIPAIIEQFTIHRLSHYLLQYEEMNVSIVWHFFIATTKYWLLKWIESNLFIFPNIFIHYNTRIMFVPFPW